MPVNLNISVQLLFNLFSSVNLSVFEIENQAEEEDRTGRQTDRQTETCEAKWLSLSDSIYCPSVNGFTGYFNVLYFNASGSLFQRQTDRHTCRKTYRQPDRHTDRHTGHELGKIQRKSNTERARQTEMLKQTKREYSNQDMTVCIIVINASTMLVYHQNRMCLCIISGTREDGRPVYTVPQLRNSFSI